MYIVQDPASHIPGNLSGKSRRTKPLRPDQEEHINSRGQSATEEGGMLTSCPPFGQRADTSSGRKAPGSNAGHPPKGAAGDGRTCVRPEKSDARRGDGPSFRPPAKDSPRAGRPAPLPADRNSSPEAHLCSNTSGLPKLSHISVFARFSGLSHANHLAVSRMSSQKITQRRPPPPRQQTTQPRTTAKAKCQSDTRLPPCPQTAVRPRAQRREKLFSEKKTAKTFGVRKKFVPLQPQTKGEHPEMFGLWCNGNTTDSGPVIPGSSPGSPTNRAEAERFPLGLLLRPTPPHKVRRRQGGTTVRQARPDRSAVVTARSPRRQWRPAPRATGSPRCCHTRKRCP